METLWDAVLPADVLALPVDPACLDALLEDGELLAPFRALWLERWPEALAQGRPTVPIETFVRLMLLKHRYGWGYETLLAEVSDSFSLRRFCRIGLGRAVPDESTFRKLVRRLGEQSISEISRLVVAKATRETRFRGRAVRIDSTVIEADMRYPTDAGLALDGAHALAREPISDRLVSLADADARPIRKGKLGNPTQFGYVAQLAEVCPSTQRGARGFLVPVTINIGNPSENELLPMTVGELVNAGLKPRIVAVDGGFQSRATSEAVTPIAPRQLVITGRKTPASRSTRRRLGRFRTGCEGRISHLKRAYGFGRSRLRGLAGVNTHTNWSILAYNLDTYRSRATAYARAEHPGSPHPTRHAHPGPATRTEFFRGK